MCKGHQCIQPSQSSSIKICPEENNCYQKIGLNTSLSKELNDNKLNVNSGTYKTSFNIKSGVRWTSPINSTENRECVGKITVV